MAQRQWLLFQKIQEGVSETQLFRQSVWGASAIVSSSMKQSPGCAHVAAEGKGPRGLEASLVDNPHPLAPGSLFMDRLAGTAASSVLKKRKGADTLGCSCLYHNVIALGMF